MAQISQFTAAEAAFILREPVRSIKKSLDVGPVRPILVPGASGSVRTIEWRDLFYLYAVRALRDELTPKARGEFYEALQQTPFELRDEVRFGRFRVSVRDLVREVKQRTSDLAALAGAVDFRADGEPLLKGKQVEVYRISALLDGGASVEQVLEEYPSLAREDVETAKAYAEAYPKVGRPFPRTSVKRALRGAGLEALDMPDNGVFNEISS
ncbi:DUF433 domain-containing protein [Mesorhizobium sp. CA14]|uniref:DUF433 domain-containing protein n=1 Tax=Mesorhizobium sp. CA14 TaxID=2876642 RepID=UPI001CCDC21B|nr:DUF433 domain-containing protein [Mesorhizobium sp. CA14]MBZ9849669.1 DUF433 domain-containing protein [Mesorhizobium sp. CA14]